MPRLRLTLGALILLTVAGTGALTKALTWPAGAVTGLTVAAASVLTVLSAALALRMLVVMDRNPRPHRSGSRPRHR